MMENLQKIVLKCCEQHNQISDRMVHIELGPAAPLYGIHGVLDSISLVSLIVAIEQSIEDEMGVIVTLADAKAASQERSPFRTVESLVNYALTRLEEEARKNG